MIQIAMNSRYLLRLEKMDKLESNKNPSTPTFFTQIFTQHSTEAGDLFQAPLSSKSWGLVSTFKGGQYAN